MARSGYTCIRRVFCWLNIILWVTGFAVFTVALWLKFSFEGYTISLLPQYALLSADSMLLLLGGITIVLAFFGCCGSWFQNRCALLTYFSLLILIFGVEFFIGSIAFVFRHILMNALSTDLISGMRHHYNVSTPEQNNLVDIWDKIQTDLKCCGVYNERDWYNIDAWPLEDWTPDSCCVVPEENCGKNPSVKLFKNGCLNQIKIWFAERLYIIGIVGVVVAFIQIFGLISSILLFCNVKKRRISETYTSFSPNGYS